VVLSRGTAAELQPNGCDIWADLPRGGLIAGMDDDDRRAQANLPAVVVPRSVTRASQANQRLTRWPVGGLPDQLRRACRHPVVVGSLTVAAELIAHAGLRTHDGARRRISAAVSPHRGGGELDGAQPPAVTSRRRLSRGKASDRNHYMVIAARPHPEVSSDAKVSNRPRWYELMNR